MTDPNYYSPLARTHRTIFFYGLLSIFIIIVPLLVLYANGYRYNPWDDNPTFTITGGMYIATQDDDSLIFVNDELVENTRFFRRATYVQNLTPGLHRVHVQGEGLQTWVKNLPVYQQIVTEAAAFTIPERPQVRPITPHMSSTGEPVFIGYEATSTAPFAFASSTVSGILTPRTSPVGWEENPEYTFLETRFANLNRTLYQADDPDGPQFRFATTSPTEPVATTSATSTKVRNDVRLERREDDIYARFTGPLRTIPYYYCVPTQDAATTTAHYGEHVSDAIHTPNGTRATTTLHERGTWLGQICRDEIRIDRMGQAVEWFDFVPGLDDLVLLQLQDGIYVTEIDDRSWQNHQLLYPGEELTVLVDGGQIFIRDGDYFAEVFLELQN